MHFRLESSGCPAVDFCPTNYRISYDFQLFADTQPKSYVDLFRNVQLLLHTNLQKTQFFIYKRQLFCMLFPQRDIKRQKLFHTYKNFLDACHSRDFSVMKCWRSSYENLPAFSCF